MTFTIYYYGGPLDGLKEITNKLPWAIPSNYLLDSTPAKLTHRGYALRWLADNIYVAQYTGEQPS